jgi:hypothetical protein
MPAVEAGLQRWTLVFTQRSQSLSGFQKSEI